MVVGAGVREDGLVGRRGIHESDGTAGRHDRIQRGEQVETGFGVEQERALVHAVVAHPALEVAQVATLSLPPSDAGLVDAVTCGSGFTPQLID